MKTATILLVLLVAGLLFVPLPANAAGFVTPEQSEQDSALQQDTPLAQTEEEDSSGIVDVRATAARLRGRVELAWRVDDQAHAGFFVVERSTNSGSWRPVKACGVRYDPTQTDYGCTDARLISGTTYAYRICTVAKGTTCSNASPSEAVTVKAP